MRRIAEWLALTKTERRVLLFLSVTLIVGVGIKWYKQSSSSEQSYDYRTEDSIFVTRSAMPEESLRTEPQMPTSQSAESNNNKSININTATQKELESLPGIGKTLAQRIIEYRMSVALFRKPEDLRNVKGITKKKFEHLKPYITVQ